MFTDNPDAGHAPTAPPPDAFDPFPPADVIAATYTACSTVAELGDGYVPSNRCRTGLGRGKRRRRTRRLLAKFPDAYDAHRAARGDPRRAHRC